MKRILPLLLAAMLIALLCACQPKAPVESVEPFSGSPTDVYPTAKDGEPAELTYMLLNYPLAATIEDGTQETIYLTSVTFQKKSAMITYLRRNRAEFPKLSVRMKDGNEFSLDPISISAGAALFSIYNELPVSEIAELKCDDSTIILSNIENRSADAEEFYKEKLNGLSKMSYIELFSYCLGSDGAYAEGAYGELAKRMTSDPEEFALRLLAPAYLFGESAKDSLETASLEENFYTKYGFDSRTKLDICVGISSACLALDVQKTIDTLNASDHAQYKTVASILSKALEEISLPK